MPTSAVFSINVSQIKPIISKEKSVPGKKKQSQAYWNGSSKCNRRKTAMFVIWRSKNPRCFKNVKHLPCEYKSQKKSWMNSEIFEQWARKLERRFLVDDRKIALITDKCPAHPSISNLTNVQIVFLPPNTMSILQLMDQGVIRSLKAHYRRRVVRLLRRALEKKYPCPKISIPLWIKLLMDQLLHLFLKKSSNAFLIFFSLQGMCS